MNVTPEQIEIKKVAGKDSTGQDVLYVQTKGGLCAFFAKSSEGYMAVGTAPMREIAKMFAERKVPGITWNDDFLQKSDPIVQQKKTYLAVDSFFFDNDIQPELKKSMGISDLYIIHDPVEMIFETVTADELEKKMGELSEMAVFRKADRSEPVQYPHDLEKGAMRRLAPFNPVKEKSPLKHDEDLANPVYNMADWQRDYDTDARNRLAQHGMTPEAHTRALHKLSGQTPTRRSEDGKREFLLHRGMSEQEFKGAFKDKKFNHREASSWTPNLDTARAFKDKADSDSDGIDLDSPDQKGNGGVGSAWVHEHNIGFVPNQYGTYKDLQPNDKSANRNDYHFENEVIVHPGHNSPAVHESEIPQLTGQKKYPEATVAMDNVQPTNVNQAINARSKLKTFGSGLNVAVKLRDNRPKPPGKK